MPGRQAWSSKASARSSYSAHARHPKLGLGCLSMKHSASATSLRRPDFSATATIRATALVWESLDSSFAIILSSLLRLGWDFNSARLASPSLDQASYRGLLTPA